jgi:hypothetical protein
MTVYLELTREFNAGRTRAVICSGQACVLHRLAIASKDGAWILRENAADLTHVLDVLAGHGARYRFGAPLDVRWLSGGWSSHFEFRSGELRVRTDFFTRPPRISSDELARMWREQDGRDPPFTDARITALMKQTDREKDFPFIGELARLMTDARDQLLFSRSATDLMQLAKEQPVLVRELTARRPLLARIGADRRALAEAIQLEMLDLMEVDARRLAAHRAASVKLQREWARLSSELDRLPPPQAHAKFVASAASLLPQRVELPAR